MNMDFLFAIVGDELAAPLGGLIIGLAFGFLAQRTRFCLRAAAIEFARGAVGKRVAVWLLAFAAAVASTQVLIASGLLDVSEARQLAGTGTLSGAVLGGALFGIGMVLARGCASRLLVLSANGNLRALLSGLVFAVAAQAALRGQLSPAREWLAGLWTASGASELNLLTLSGHGPALGLWLALAGLAIALAIAVRARASRWAVAGALGVGLTVGFGWLITYVLSTRAFVAVQVESLSFTGPSADTLMFVLTPGAGLDFDVGLVPGVFLGSFLAAWLFRELKIEGFTDGYSMRRYIAGAVLMGFGGMLAGGCAVGAGLTGGSVFAVTAWLALFAMWASAALTDWVVDRRAERDRLHSAVPAE